MKKFLLVFVLFLVAVPLRLYNLDSRGLITDEKFTLLNINGIMAGGANVGAFKKDYFTAEEFWEEKGIMDYIYSVAHSDFGTHVVYNTFLIYWMKVFGNHDYSLRLPGVLFNLLNILLVFFLVYKYFKNYWAAFLAALLLAIDPLNIAQSHIARSYPLSFLLITLSTEFFIRLVSGKDSVKNFVIYGVLIGLSMLNHYINFFVPLGHALIFLFLQGKNARLWKAFLLIAVANVGLMVYWLNWGGGYTAFDFLRGKNELHKSIAEDASNELSNTFQKATPELIIKRSIGLFFDIGVFGHGLFNKLNGVKDFISSILIFLILASVQRKVPSSVYIKALFLLIIVGLLFVNRVNIFGVVGSVAILYAVYYALLQLWEYYKLRSLRGGFILLSMGVIMLVLPIVFVMQEAFSSGTNTSLTHRYIGNASPFVVILIGVGVVAACRKSILVAGLFCFVAIMQYAPIKERIVGYYNDESEYNAFFVPARVYNPYITAAKKVMDLAVVGDTLYIPGGYRDKYQIGSQREAYNDYRDAQYLNVYFPKDYKLVQHVYIGEKDKLYLKRSNGSKILIYDFKGDERRY